MTIIIFLGWVPALLYCLYLAMKWRTMSPFALSIPGIAFTSYLGLLLFPGLVLATQDVNAVAMHRFVIILVSAGVFMILGFSACSLLYPSGDVGLRDLIRAPVSLPASRQLWLAALVMLFLVVACIFLKYYHFERSVPLYYMLTHFHDYEGISRARDASKLAEQGIARQLSSYGIVWTAQVIVPLVAICMQGMHEVTRKWKYLVFYFTSVLVGCLLAMWEANKSGGARVLAVFLGASLLVRGRLAMKHVVVACLAVSLPFMLAIIIHPADMDRSDVIDGMLERAFVTPARMTYQYMEVFPEHQSYTLGRGTNLLGSWLGRDPANLSLLVSRHFSEDVNTTTFANCGFIGSAWAEFGYFGVVVFSFLAGFVPQWINSFVLRSTATHGKRVQYIMLQAMQIPIWTVALVSNPLTQIFLGYGLIFALGIVELCDRVLYRPPRFQMLTSTCARTFR